MSTEIKSGMTRRQFSSLLLGLAATVAFPKFSFAENTPRTLRVAVSTETLAGTNVNDARAAYKVWTQELLRSLKTNIRAEPVPEIFVSSEQILRMIRERSIDCFGLTAWEYAEALDLIDPDWLVLEDYLAEGIEYLLIVHHRSSIKGLQDLRGVTVLSHHHRDTNLSPAWLGTLLAANRLPAPARFFGSLVERSNLNQVVLPVFFRGADAALVTRNHFSTAVELNPQLGRDLRILEVSPRLVPLVLAFSRTSNAADKKALREALLKITSVPAGRQIMELYQSRGLVERPGHCMKETLQMLRQYGRMRIQTG